MISNNIATLWGGAVALGGNGSTLASLVNVDITGNFAGYGGGCIYACYEDNRIFLGNCILENNHADISYPMDQEVYFDDDGVNNEIAFCYTDIEGGL